MTAALASGCTATVTGKGAIESPPDVRIGRNILDILPTHEELSVATGVAIRRDEFGPRVGGVRVLGRGGDYGGRGECIGVAKEGAARAYRELPVWAVATADWRSDGTIESTVFVDVAAIAMRSDAAARDALTAFGQRWEECRGAELRSDYASGSGLELAYRINEVNTGPSWLDGDVAFIADSAGKATIVRVLTGQANCIVDVSVTVYRHDGASVSDDVAANVARIMLERIAQI